MNGRSSAGLSYFSLAPHARTPELPRTNGRMTRSANHNAHLLAHTDRFSRSPSSNHSSCVFASVSACAPRSIVPSPAAPPLTHEMSVGEHPSPLSAGNHEHREAADTRGSFAINDMSPESHGYCDGYDTHGRFVIKDSCSSSSSSGASSSDDMNTVVNLGDIMPSEDIHVDISPHAHGYQLFPVHPLEGVHPAASHSLGGRSEGLLLDENHEACSTRVTNEIVEQCLQNVQAIRERAYAARAASVTSVQQECSSHGDAPDQDICGQSKLSRDARSSQKRSALLNFMSSPRKSVCDALGRLKGKRDQSMAVHHTTFCGAHSQHNAQAKTALNTNHWANPKHSIRQATSGLSQKYYDETIGVVYDHAATSPCGDQTTKHKTTTATVRAYGNLSPRARRVTRRTISACAPDPPREVCVQRKCVMKSYHHLGLTRRYALIAGFHCFCYGDCTS